MASKSRIKKENAAPFSDFIKVVAHKARLKPATIQKAYNAMYEYIVEELLLRGAVYLKHMGYFGLIPSGGYDKLMPEAFGSPNMVYRYVERYNSLRFSPTQSFIDKVNEPLGGEKEPPHKKGELIDPNSELKAKRRSEVKWMLIDEGHKMHDPEYKEKSVEVLRLNEGSDKDK